MKSSKTVLAEDANQYILINITPALVAWLNKTQANDGIALLSNSPLNATFDSKESTTTSDAKRLSVEPGSQSGNSVLHLELET